MEGRAIQAEWAKLFPINVTDDYTSSVTFIKKLTLLALSTITYLRDFPQENYTIEHFAGLRLRILKKRCKDEYADFVSKTLMQCFEAFDQKYLGYLALCFYKGESIKENLVEYHLFEYTYTKGVSMSVRQRINSSFEKIQERTLQLIRSCIVLTLSSPYSVHNCDNVNIRIGYNDDAPEGHLAGFKAVEEGDEHLCVADEQICAAGELFTMHRVFTPFHSMRARVFIRHSPEAIPSQKPQMMTQADENDFGDDRSPFAPYGCSLSPVASTSKFGRVRPSGRTRTNTRPC